MFKYLFPLFLIVAILAPVAKAQTIYSPNIIVTVQPIASDTIRWSSGTYVTKMRNNTITMAKGFEVKSTSAGGILAVHVINDYDASGNRVWLKYVIPASSGVTQRIGMAFDRIDSAQTTIPKADVIVWY